MRAWCLAPNVALYREFIIQLHLQNINYFRGTEATVELSTSTDKSQIHVSHRWFFCRIFIPPLQLDTQTYAL